MIIIEGKNIVKAFGQQQQVILKSISFSVTKGDYVALTGRSGSGKSTLLYAVSGLDNLTSGEVWLIGKNIHQLKNKELHLMRNKNIGFVFQFHYLLPELTALENILMPARKFGSEKAKKAFAEHLMHEFGVFHCKAKLPSQMSGGEMQRTAIARALIMEPDILFADEPTGNLDTENSEKVISIFEEINRNLKTTILMVTHELDFAARANRKIHLVDGKIAEDVRRKQ